MKEISPRLVRLLELLLALTEPISVDAIAKMLNSSRRTLFRELENSGDVLSQYNLEIESSPGKGIRLIAQGTERQNLLNALHKTPCHSNKKERQLCLLLMLLSNDGIIQKLFFYSNALGVSEATISCDLDELEPFLESQDILLIRKSGLGIYAVAREIEIRTAMASALLRDGDTGVRTYSLNYGYPGTEIEEGVNNIIKKLYAELDWLSEESLKMLSVFLMVIVERIKKGTVAAKTNGTSGVLAQKLAKIISAEIYRYFSIDISPIESDGIATLIQSCRSKLHSPLEPATGENKTSIEELTWKMIECFDAKLAPVLKTDEQLFEGLFRHLSPAITRIKNKVELSDPFKGHLDNQYQDLYQKSVAASKILESYLMLTIPPYEISFIAVHFYAALLRVGEKNIRKRVLKAGVVCVSGIGISYMVAAQLCKRYSGELEIEICPWNDLSSFEKTDFIISTIPLNDIDISVCDKPLVFVNTLLEDIDYQNIRAVINKLAFVEKTVSTEKQRRSLDSRIETVIVLMQKTKTLLENFSVMHVSAELSFKELIMFCAEHFGIDDHGIADIVKTLTARGKVSSPVIDELKIVLLHTRTNGVCEPVFSVIKPVSGSFKDNYFNGAKSCCLMLLPQYCPGELTKIMGNISAILIDVPEFLEAVQEGNSALIKTILEAELSDALSKYCTEKLKS
ncbi:MAG: PRD domain-containing protein [Spirochaetaceae bacterium]|jgi:transcriptional antiterminator|nr:PRD domain-containing protein [Spirochaetaceae bacterium]